MTFDINYWNTGTSGKNTKASSNFLYTDDTDTLATIAASAYFNDQILKLVIGDKIWVVASDANALLEVTSVTTNVTTIAILHSDVSHRIVYAAEVTTVGGAASEAFTVTGALATDLLFVELHTEGASAVTILNAYVSAADTITVVFSADPSSDHVFAYSVIRAM